jgi:hypothetical protein
VACLLGTALLVAGCGAERHANDQRPQVSTRVSVTIGPDGVIVDPRRIAFGPERTQQIPQNQNHPQPPIETKKPLDVIFVAANQTTTDSELVIRGAADGTSEPVLAHSPGTFQIGLPTGSYTVSAPGIPGARSAKLDVGPYRASSQNDVLLP